MKMFAGGLVQPSDAAAMLRVRNFLVDQQILRADAAPVAPEVSVMTLIVGAQQRWRSATDPGQRAPADILQPGVDCRR